MNLTMEKQMMELREVILALAYHWTRHTGIILNLNESVMDLKIATKICGHSSTWIIE